MIDIKGRGISIIFLGVSATFYILALFLAFGAESHRSPVVVRHDESLSYCIYSNGRSTALASVASVLLLLAHGMIAANTRWCWGPSPSLEEGGHRLAILLFFGISWFSFVISEILLVAGIIENWLQTKGENDCSELRKGIFTSAGAFTLLTMILLAAYFGFVLTARDESTMDSSVGSSVGMTSVI